MKSLIIVTTLYIKKPFNFIFLSVLGIKEKLISARVTVKLSGISSIEEVRPIAIAKQSLAYGKRYILSNRAEKAGGEVVFLPLNLGEGSYKTNMKYGCGLPLKVGDGVFAFTGDIGPAVTDGLSYLVNKCNHQPVCTYEAYSENCSKIIILPVLDRQGGHK